MRLTPWTAAALLVGVWAATYLPFLGRALPDHDELRRILPALVMLETGDAATLMLEGERYDRKPPLGIWVHAAALAAGGGRAADGRLEAGSVAARLPAALSALGAALAVTLVPGRAIALRARLTAGLLLLATPALIAQARTANIDTPYLAATALATALVVRAWGAARADEAGDGAPEHAPGAGVAAMSPASLWVPALAVSAAGLLVKGPLILLFVYALALPLAARAGGARVVLSGAHAAGLAVMLAGALAPLLLARALSPEAGGDGGAIPAGGREGSGEAARVASTWLAEMLVRLTDEVAPTLRGRRLLGAVAQLLPVLALLPFVLRAELRSPRRALVAAGITGLAVPFVLVNALPLAKARYTLPLLPLLCLLVGAGLDALPSGAPLLVWWRRLLTATLGLLAAAGALATASLALLRAGLAPAPALSPMTAHGLSLVSLPEAACAALAAALLLALALRGAPLLEGAAARLSLASGLLAAALVVHAGVWAAPIDDAEATHALDGIAASVPPGEAVHKVCFTAREPYLFRDLGTPSRVVTDPARLPAGARVVLVQEAARERVERRARAAGIPPLREARTLAIRGRTYVLLVARDR